MKLVTEKWEDNIKKAQSSLQQFIFIELCDNNNNGFTDKHRVFLTDLKFKNHLKKVHETHRLNVINCQQAKMKVELNLQI